MFKNKIPEPFYFQPFNFQSSYILNLIIPSQSDHAHLHRHINKHTVTKQENVTMLGKLDSPEVDVKEQKEIRLKT